MLLELCAGKMLPGQFWVRSLDLEVDRRLFPSIALDLVLDGLSLVERVEAGPLYSRDMNEHILAAAARWLNEPIPLGRIEPLHSACSHALLLVALRCLVHQNK
jgi:hypothetical protein